MKTLKCEYDWWEGFQVVEMDVDSLHQSVPTAHDFNGKPFYQLVKADIAQNGMKFPLLVVDAKYWQLLGQWSEHQQHMAPLPSGYKSQDQIYVVWGGSNRLVVAKELGYDKVDCVIIPDGDFKCAWGLQPLHRKDYTELYKKHE